MNTFTLIIVFAFILEFFLKLTGSILNLKAFRLDIPPALQGIYKSVNYRKSQQYISVSTSFGLKDSSFSLVFLLLFWISGGFPFFCCHIVPGEDDKHASSWNVT